MTWLILISIPFGLISWIFAIRAIIVAKKEKKVSSINLMYISFVCSLLAISFLIMPYLTFASELQDVKLAVQIFSVIFMSGTCGLNGAALNNIVKISKEKL